MGQEFGVYKEYIQHDIIYNLPWWRSGVQEREGQEALDWAQELFIGSWKPFCMWCQQCSMKLDLQVSLLKG